MNQMTTSTRWALGIPVIFLLACSACSSDVQIADASAGSGGNPGGGSTSSGGSAQGGSSSGGSAHGGASSAGTGGTLGGSGSGGAGGMLASGGGGSAGMSGGSNGGSGGSGGATCQSQGPEATFHGGVMKPLSVGTYCDDVFLCFSSVAEANAAAAAHQELTCGGQIGEVQCPQAQSCSYQHPSINIAQSDVDGLCSLLGATSTVLECFIVGPR